MKRNEANRRGSLAFTFVLVALFATFLAHAAFTQDAPITPQPGPNNPILAILQKPFAGNFQIANLLDHAVPQQFVDANGFQINYWGELTTFLDGHQGYDFLMPEGTVLLASVSGQVVVAGSESPFF